MREKPLMLRAALLVLGLPMLSGCAILSNLFNPSPSAPGPTEAVYRAAMADFSDCATTPDRAARAVIAARLAQAATMLEAETRPSDPDHFFMTDRVSAAARYCAAAAGE